MPPQVPPAPAPNSADPAMIPDHRPVRDARPPAVAAVRAKTDGRRALLKEAGYRATLPPAGHAAKQRQKPCTYGQCG